MPEFDYFVMLNCTGGRITPMTDSDDNVAMFETIEEANEAARDNMLGEAYGFEVFCKGCGEF